MCCFGCAGLTLLEERETSSGGFRADYHCLWSAFVFLFGLKRFLVGDYGALPSLGALFSLLSGSRRFKHTGVVSSEIVGPHVNKAIK